MARAKAARAIFYSLSALLVSTAAVQAESSQALLTRVFQTGDYDALENLAAEKIGENPSDAVAHYFMGVAYYQQKRFNLAAPEFQEVLRYSKNPEEIHRARQYLTALGGQAAARPAAQATPVKSPLANAANPQTADKALQERIKFLRDQAKSKKVLASQRFDSEVKQIKSREFKDSSGSPNPETQKQVNDAFARLSKYESDVDKELDQQIADLIHPTSNPRGDSRVSTSGGGLLKSYEHLGDDSQAVNIPSENALSAKAQSLKASKKK